MSSAKNSGGSGAGGKRKATGKPFAKGDPRINRGGRPQGFSAAIRDICGDDPTELAKLAYSIARGEMSIDTVKPMKLSIGNNGGDEIVDHPLVEVPNHDQRLKAIEFLRDTGWGKPVQAVEVDGKGGKGIVVFMPSEKPE